MSLKSFKPYTKSTRGTILVNKDNRGTDLNSDLPKVGTVDRKNTRNIATCIKACRKNPVK